MANQTTLQNPTFGKIKTANTAVSTSATEVTTIEADGTISKMAVDNLLVAFNPSAYTPTTPTIVGHLEGLDNLNTPQTTDTVENKSGITGINATSALDNLNNRLSTTEVDVDNLNARLPPVEDKLATIESGTYVPEFTIQVNLSDIKIESVYYTKVGNIVTEHYSLILTLIDVSAFEVVFMINSIKYPTQDNTIKVGYGVVMDQGISTPLYIEGNGIGKEISFVYHPNPGGANTQYLHGSATYEIK